MAGGNGEKASVVESKEWYLAAYAPVGVPTSDHLKLRSLPLSLAVDSIPDGHVVVETLFVSVDPYQRTRMTGIDEGLYLSQFNLEEVITAFAIGRVIRSKDSNYKEGDIILNPFSPIADYYMVSELHLRKIDPASGVPLPDYLSSLGIPGFAAWVGIEVLGEPKAGSNVFVSAAAGAVGMYAGQLAKLKGCRVVGSTGSDEKVKLVKDHFGYDDAFNYKKETDLDAALRKYFPDGIDIYFDNVGGEMLEAVLNHVNKHARIPICGMISQYKKKWTDRHGVRNLLNIVGKEIRMEGFLLASYLDRFGDFAKEMESYIKEGKISSKYTIYHGIESYLDSLGSVFTSTNIGKVVIEVKS
ncbi:2-alkenal reductase (NADP(+)-dependent)-like [Juglans regia]|uniref:2-alkenal reductase (NADP(+)-dependent)-like n=2 Tax=Juglans regia TaxID=51240 RepID=A0A2I4GX24_JUGRE|nr:2-alkenal reductase (NADP(+)-dependent)-like [Juglans regia]